MSKIIPNSSYLPNIYIDELMYLLTSDEWKVLTYACRRIFGFHKEGYADRISISQFTDGTKSSEDECLDRGTGLNHGTVSKCIASLCDYGVMTRIAPNNSRNEGVKYALQLDDKRINFFGLQQRSDAQSARYAGRLSVARSKRSSRENNSGKTLSHREGPSMTQSTPPLWHSNTKESSNKEEIKNSETENSNINSHLSETEAHADLPVLHTQTGDEIEHEDFTLIPETSEIKQSTVEQTNRGIETDSSDQQKESNTAAPPKRGPGRPPKSAAQAAMPLGRATTNGEAAKPAKQGKILTPGGGIIYSAMVTKIGWGHKPTIFTRERDAANEIAKLGYTVENIVNHYNHIKATQDWAKESFVSLAVVLKNHEAWLSAGKPNRSTKRYINPTNKPVDTLRVAVTVDMSMDEEVSF